MNKSTLSAEAIAFWERYNTTYLVSVLTKEANILYQNGEIHTYTDNQTLYGTINSTNQVSDKSIRVEISAVQEIQNENQVETFYMKSGSQ